VSQTATTTTYLYPFKWYSVASSTGTGAKFATTTDYVFSGDSLVATVDQQTASGNATGTSKTRYIHPDHLGSTNVVTDASGTVVQTLDYYPFGSTRISTNSGGADSARKYIGQFSDQSNLEYLQSRYYDPARGQFLTEDPVFPGNPTDQSLSDPQSLNAYSYAENNPITSKDPSGRGLGPAGTILLGILASLLIVASNLLTFLAANPVGNVSVATVHDQLPALTSPASSATQKGYAMFSIGLSLAAPESNEGGAAKDVEEEVLAEKAAITSQKLSISDSTAAHIFRDAPGHVQDAPANRELITNTANDSTNFLGTDSRGNDWHAAVQSNGSQVWVQSRNGTITNAGVNETPKTFNSQTGLSAAGTGE
jgi:RHS repeat-associated protein